jgi:hypothetical protein
MTYIYLIAVSWWLVYFEPLQIVIDRLASILILKTKGTLRELINGLHGAAGCPKCVGFWVSLIWGGFLTACIVSLLTYILELCLQNLRKNL